jgi:hypothetical protein
VRVCTALAEHGGVEYYSGNKIEKNEVERACNTCGLEERCIQDFGEET